jgi:hypothetical protein
VQFATKEDLCGDDSAVVLRDWESCHGALHLNVITEYVERGPDVGQHTMCLEGTVL